jgi:hypothetical protein
MRPSVELRAKSSPSRQAEHDPDCAVFAGDPAGRAGWGPVRKDAVRARRAPGASPG